MRCLAAVLSMCGVPTTMEDGKTPLRRDAKSIKKIANEVVKKVYQHVSSPSDEAYVGQRKALALRFRQKYGSDNNGIPNANPFFIGVFDTVASLGSKRLSLVMIAGAFAALMALSWIQSLFLFPFIPTFFWLFVATVFFGEFWYAVSHLRYATGLKDVSFWRTLHFTSPKMEFYDPHLDNEVRYARQALSIDENRADFSLVPWGSTANKGPPQKETDPGWLQQIWFAGNHSDIGGSYPENESRLSDITLEWMVHAATNLPDETTPDGFGVKTNPLLLQVRPNALGPQHDEREPGFFGRKWPRGLRTIQPVAKLHSSVYARAFAEKVLHFYDHRKYDPENLSGHIEFQEKKRQPQITAVHLPASGGISTANVPV
jgi:hypothetical protein